MNNLWHQTKFLLLAVMAIAVMTACGDDNGGDDGTEPGAGGQLVIENGSQTVDAGGSNKTASVQYQAAFVATDGTKEPVQANWTVANSDIASISASGQLSVQGGGVTFVKAEIERDGATYTAQAPLRVKTQSVFSVAPWAAILFPGEQVPLEPVLFSTSGSATYSFESSNSGVASIQDDNLSSAGKGVKGESAGEAVVTVTAQTSDGDLTFQVPILVIGVPEAPLPVTRVEVSPKSAELFRDDTEQFTATPKNADGETVNTEVSWRVSDQSVATIDANGLLTAKEPGEVTIIAEADGILGEAQVTVYPDTIVIVKPFYASESPGGTINLTAEVHDARALYNGQSGSQISSHPSINWQIPTFDFPGGDLFNIGTISASGNLNTSATVTINSNATPGLSSFAVAQVGNSQYAIGAANINVGIGGGGGGGPDCSGGDAAIQDITVDNSTSVTLDLFGNSTHQIEITATDGSGGTISSPDVVYHSDNEQVATVDNSGFVTAGFSAGTATITICAPNASASVTVTVQQ